LKKRFGFIGFLLIGLVTSFLKFLPSLSSKNKTRLLFFLKLSALIIYGWSQKLYIYPYSIYRSAEEQNRLYQTGRGLNDFRAIITNKDGYKKKSTHQFWRAADILILDDNLKGDWSTYEKYLKLGLFWEKLGGTWGYRWYERGETSFRDYYHFEV